MKKYRIRFTRDNGTKDWFERPGDPAFFNTREEAEDYCVRISATFGKPSKDNPYRAGGNIQCLEVCECEE